MLRRPCPRTFSFNIDYRTNWGEAVYLTGDLPELGNGDRSKAIKLDLYGEQTWKTKISLPDGTGDFTYSYFVQIGRASCRERV